MNISAYETMRTRCQSWKVNIRQRSTWSEYLSENIFSLSDVRGEKLKLCLECCCGSKTGVNVKDTASCTRNNDLGSLKLCELRAQSIDQRVGLLDEFVQIIH